jgi:hypothetical protein
LPRGIPRIGKLHAQERSGFAPIASLLGEPSKRKSKMDVKQRLSFSARVSVALCESRRLVRLGSAIFLQVGNEPRFQTFRSSSRIRLRALCASGETSIDSWHAIAVPVGRRHCGFRSKDRQQGSSEQPEKPRFFSLTHLSAAAARGAQEGLGFLDVNRGSKPSSPAAPPPIDEAIASGATSETTTANPAATPR